MTELRSIQVIVTARTFQGFHFITDTNNIVGTDMGGGMHPIARV